MGTRLIEIAVNRSALGELRSALEERQIDSVWCDEISDDLALARVAVDSALTEELTDALEEKFGGSDGFRLLLVPVEAVLPRPKEQDPDDQAEVEQSERLRLLWGRTTSREELYEDVRDSIRSSALGLANDDVAVVIDGVHDRRERCVHRRHGCGGAPAAGFDVRPADRLWRMASRSLAQPCWLRSTSLASTSPQSSRF